MAETVEQELQRKLNGAQAALDEVNEFIRRYNSERIVLEKRVEDLNRALGAFELTNVGSIND